MHQACAVLCRASLAMLLFSCHVVAAVGCGDERSLIHTDAGIIYSDAGVIHSDAGVIHSDAGRAGRDASAEVTEGSACPPSGEPAMDGCPCHRPEGDYCCFIGTGVHCSDEGVWSVFFDSPCYYGVNAPEDDAGNPLFDIPQLPEVPIIECEL